LAGDPEFNGRPGIQTGEPEFNRCDIACNGAGRALGNITRLQRGVPTSVNASRTPFPEHYAAFRLDGSGGSVSAARGCARAYLEQCLAPLSPDAAQDALVMVSELVANAVSHAPGPCCLYLVEDEDDLTIAVSDDSTTVPMPRAPDLSGGGGFGWHLLRRLARRVDVYVRPPWGKTVCATMRIFTRNAPVAV
jgi:anti-sigma regulatory factor (Ser/Thr protein kinase)